MLADPTRAAIVMALMDGRFRSAKKLALDAGVTPQTASAHLKKLVESNMLTSYSQGRCKYFKISSSDVANAVEALCHIAPSSPPDRALSPTMLELRFARCCYDHLAGRLGVAITEAAERLGLALSKGGEFRLTGRGKRFLAQLGIDVESLLGLRRPLLRSCADWTERRPHVAGSLGAALLRTYKEKRWLLPVEGSRKLTITPQGRAAFRSLFDMDEDLLSAANPIDAAA
jgi:DNA-binding transcriptional ArsR family regulator